MPYLTIGQSVRHKYKLSKDAICINCGKPARALHHIVPLSLGGNDIPSNRVFLCQDCHDLIHLKTEISKSNLLKMTFKFQKKYGYLTVGKPKAQKPANWDEVAIQVKNKIITNTKAMQLTGVSRTTYYKYRDEWNKTIQCL